MFSRVRSSALSSRFAALTVIKSQPTRHTVLEKVISKRLVLCAGPVVRTHTELITSYEEGTENVGGESMFSSHAQRLRVRRLRWLYKFVKDHEEGIAEDLKYKLMAKFGLIYRTSRENCLMPSSVTSCVRNLFRVLGRICSRLDV